jgi:hypothetical protein
METIRIIKKMSYILFEFIVYIELAFLIMSWLIPGMHMIDLAPYVETIAVIYIGCDRWEDRHAKKQNKNTH